MGYIQQLRRHVGSQPLIMVGAGVINIDEDGRVLMILRTDNGCWGLPGGALEPGETLEDTARRELTEETGLSAGGLELLTVLSGPDFFYRYPNGDEVHNVIALFVADEVTGVEQPCGIEATEVCRFHLSALPDNLDPIDSLSINAYLELQPPGPAH